MTQELNELKKYVEWLERDNDRLRNVNSYLKAHLVDHYKLHPVDNLGHYIRPLPVATPVPPPPTPKPPQLPDFFSGLLPQL